ncbi:MAG: hypothetical protein J6X99_04715 [Bacteroidales bacterium]|nr:hypothetical protein [Bacteroidales bacterium]
MRNKIFGAVLLSLSLIGCRKESSTVLSYAFKDDMAFEEADSSFAAKFDVMWNGLNCNYALWDFEKEHGLDWDRVYDTYRPKFEELDKVDTLVSDKQLSELLTKVVAPLHDGHLNVQMKNHHSGGTVAVSPGATRVLSERKEELMQALSFNPVSSIQLFYQPNGYLLDYKHSNSLPLLSILEKVRDYVVDQANALEEKEHLNPEEASLLKAYKAFLEDFRENLLPLLDRGSEKALEYYNKMVLRYEYLSLPGLVAVNEKLLNYNMDITYALFKDNIAYLRISGFKVCPFIKYTEEIFGKDIDPDTQAIIDAVKAVWAGWFGAIQEHHAKGDLGGVIIDVRSNGGGMMADYPFVFGALLPSGGFRVTDARFKRGPGRYDYSPVLPQTMSTYEEEHATVTEPIVVLCNCYSVSMAEQTSMSAKLLENATLIGTRTWGGLSALASNESYSGNYAGHTGVEGETAVYCYTPEEVVISQDGKILEGYGIEPDIEVAFDVAAWDKGTGPDNQLDAALQHIRSKK